MIKYRFSKREIVLIVIFAIILIGLLWYQFVFVNTSTQAASLDAAIAETQQQTQIAEMQATRMHQMQEETKQLKADGAKRVVVPQYDNTSKLMAKLNSVLGSTDDFSLSFDDMTFVNDMARRGVTINFTCSSLGKVRSVMRQLEYETYACSIDSVTMNTVDVQSNTSGNASTAGKSSAATATLHATFYENAPGMSSSEENAS